LDAETCAALTAGAITRAGDSLQSEPVTARIPCRAVLLDAGGVIVLPDRHLLAGALARAGIDIDPAAVPRAHYLAVRTLDRALGYTAERATDPTNACATTPATARATTPATARATDRNTTLAATRADYPRALLPQLGIVRGRMAEALEVWERIADRGRFGQVLWREPTPGATTTIDALRRAGIAVLIVTNSDGHAAENLAACGFAGIPIVDSTVVGFAKPDARIFHAALARAGATAAETVHVGDTLANDVAGACAAGITPIHFDPRRACRAREHFHVRSLPGICRHVRSSAPRSARAGRASSMASQTE